MMEEVDLATLAQRIDTIQSETDLRPIDFADAVLALLFLTLANLRFERVKAEVEHRGSQPRRRRAPGPADYQAEGAYLFPEDTTLAALLAAPGDQDLGDFISAAVRKLAQNNPDLRAVLNIDFRRLPNHALQELLKVCGTVKSSGESAAQEAFSVFLTRYALDEDSSSASVGYTPSSIAMLIASLLDLPRGRVLDPYCRGADLLVALASHARKHRHDATSLSLCGQTPTRSLERRAAMNLVAHRVDGAIRTGRPLVDDPYSSVGAFDGAVVNPPFNEDGPDPRSVDGDRRFALGLPLTRTGAMKKANYLWIQVVRAALKPGGRGAILLPNSAADATASELVIRRRLIEAGEIEAVFNIGPNFYETGSNPVMLWFLRKPRDRDAETLRVLFVDAKNVTTELGRARSTWVPAQVEFLANIVRLYRGDRPESKDGSTELTGANFPDGTYAEVAGLCRVATVGEIETQRWSLNPGRYVGAAVGKIEDFAFVEHLADFNEALRTLNSEARSLQDRIAQIVSEILSSSRV